MLCPNETRCSCGFGHKDWMLPSLSVKCFQPVSEGAKITPQIALAICRIAKATISICILNKLTEFYSRVASFVYLESQNSMYIWIALPHPQDPQFHLLNWTPAGVL